MKIRFFSYIDAFRALSLFFFKEREEVFYFDISGPGRILLRLLGLSGRVKRLEFSLSELRDASGQSYFPRINGKDILSACDAIERDILSKDSFIRAFAVPFDEKKIIIYFRKIAQKRIHETITFMNVIEWFCTTGYGEYHDAVEFHIERTVYFPVLKAFALKEHHISLSQHLSLRRSFGFLYRFGGNAYLAAVMCLKGVANIPRGSRKPAAGDGRPMLASLYTVRGLTFDPALRSDFPWLLNSDIPRKRVLVYFERQDVPVTGEMAKVLREQKVNSVAVYNGASTTPDVPVHRFGAKAVRCFLSMTARSVFIILKEMASLRFKSFLFFADTLPFAREYSKAYDFYLSNNIRINVDFTDFDPNRIARHLALKAAGGVSISHQLSNWPIPNVILGSCADVFFLFGPYYHKKFLASGSSNHAVVFSGYLTDYAISAVKERSALTRQRLMERGARFIITYFDENSSGGRMSVITNEKATAIYSALLGLVLQDDKVGLICSPKRPATLLKRLPGIADMVKKAQATGRCVFVGGEYSADKYPTESAQAADIVIGLLLGGTATLESFLSGSRVVYLDLEGLYSYDEYKWGKDTVVFDSIDGLLSAIEKFRRDKSANDAPQDPALVRTLNEKDPFSDKKAARRMGQYLNWLLQAFDQGKTREEALVYASRKYAGEWGAQNIIRRKDGSVAA